MPYRDEMAALMAQGGKLYEGRFEVPDPDPVEAAALPDKPLSVRELAAQYIRNNELLALDEGFPEERIEDMDFEDDMDEEPHYSDHQLLDLALTEEPEHTTLLLGSVQGDTSPSNNEMRIPDQDATPGSGAPVRPVHELPNQPPPEESSSVHPGDDRAR